MIFTASVSAWGGLRSCTVNVFWIQNVFQEYGVFTGTLLCNIVLNEEKKNMKKNLREKLITDFWIEMFDASLTCLVVASHGDSDSTFFAYLL